jgi:single-stranded-DNA-specific exonuclease
VDCTAVGFTLAPRINAAGRMGHAREAVELLTTATGQRAEEIATWLESQNRDRQSTEKKMVEIAKQQLDEQQSAIGNGQSAIGNAVIVVAHESFHAGVVGIVASRIVDLYHRPTFVLSLNEAEAHGSARSVAGFELHEAIEHVRDLLISGGGHAMAGGVKLLRENLDAFRDRLAAYGSERLTEEFLTPTLPVDGVLKLDECVPETIQWLEKLEPFGRGNPQPRFLIENVRLTAPPRRVGSTGAHLQLTIASGPPGRPQRVARCIAFKMGPLEPQLPVGVELNLIVEPKIDCFNGHTKVDLVLVDLAKCDQEPFDPTP